MGYMVTDGPTSGGEFDVEHLIDRFDAEPEKEGLNEAIECIAVALVINDGAIYDDPTKFESYRLLVRALAVLQRETATSTRVEYDELNIRTFISSRETATDGGER